MGSVLSARTGTVSRPARLGPAKRDGPHVGPGRVCNLPAEDLTTDLSRIADIFVIARNTAYTYKGKSNDAKQVGRELAVRYLLEGSVRRSGQQVRVNDTARRY